MRRKAILPVVAVLIGLLTACALPLIGPDERKEVCRVIVDEKFGSPVFQPNVFSNPAGGLAGAGLGAIQGLMLAPNLLAIVTVPIGAVVGAAGGGACAMASIAHPTANTDFKDLLDAADVRILARTLQAELHAPRTECALAPATGAIPAGHGSVIEIEKVRAGMDCLLGRMEYWIVVDWRTVSLRSGKELNSTATRCAVASFHDAGAWFANRGRAQAEIEGVLAATGRRMVLQLLTEDVLRGECRLQLNEAGEVRAR